MKSILIGLTLTLWILWSPAYTQTDSVYCLPISKARHLVADALRLRVSDSSNVVLSERVALLQEERIKVQVSYTNLLKIEQEKVKLNQELTNHQKLISDSFSGQSEHYRKQSRKRGWQRNGLAVILVVVIGLSL